MKNNDFKTAPVQNTNTSTSNLSTYKGIMQPAPVGCPNDYKLCDYFAASSAYSFIPGNTPYTNLTTDAIKKVIQAGARLVELHVYGRNGKPVVGLQEDTGKKVTSTMLSMNDCCVAIANSAWNATEAKNCREAPLPRHDTSALRAFRYAGRDHMRPARFRASSRSASDAGKPCA